MSRADILSKVQMILRDTLDDDKIVLTETSTANDVDEWDSVNHVRLMVALEAAFNIRFETEEISAPGDVGDLVTLIGEKLR